MHPPPPGGTAPWSSSRSELRLSRRRRRLDLGKLPPQWEEWAFGAVRFARAVLLLFPSKKGASRAGVVPSSSLVAAAFIFRIGGLAHRHVPQSSTDVRTLNYGVIVLVQRECPKEGEGLSYSQGGLVGG